jgi:hypothetical protein
VVVAAVLAAGCRSMPPDDVAIDAPGSAIDAPPPIGGDKAAPCSGLFGNAITQAFGRIDGTVHAVIPPDDQDCPMSNRTHLQVEVETGGAMYRLFVNVESDQGPPDVYEKELDAPIVGPAWSDGWHVGIPNDYAVQLGLHAPDFTEITTVDLVPKITDQLNLGDKISIFASSSNPGSDSAHLVHRVGSNQDGGIVLHPDGATPHWIVMRFDEQTF